ncbi:MAG: molybdopterin molybdenumtransferase MoeA, partial [Bacteroidota bacterium]|nr:molybdopterin molybdenumtransferase MoeA [Bacteroidota bacterium]
AQESFRLSSYARAGCLVRIEEEIMEVPQGSEVEIHLLPRY